MCAVVRAGRLVGCLLGLMCACCVACWLVRRLSARLLVVDCWFVACWHV